jgi:hypothetical protein
MIKLTFIINREVFQLEINQREIWYSDRKWKRAVRLIPTDEHFIRKIKLSRNKIPASLTDFFNLTKAEQEEYDKAKDDNELAEICIKDINKKGAKLIKRENGD